MNKPSHYIKFNKPHTLAKKNRYIPRMAIETQKHPNFNRENGWKRSTTRDSLIKFLNPQTMVDLRAIYIYLALRLNKIHCLGESQIILFKIRSYMLHFLNVK